MIVGSHCVTLVSEIRPKLLLVFEKINPLSPNVKEITCTNPSGIHFID